MLGSGGGLAFFLKEYFFLIGDNKISVVNQVQKFSLFFNFAAHVSIEVKGFFYFNFLFSFTFSYFKVLLSKKLVSFAQYL